MAYLREKNKCTGCRGSDSAREEEKAGLKAIRHDAVRKARTSSSTMLLFMSIPITLCCLGD